MSDPNMTTQGNEPAVTPAGTDAGTTVIDTGGAAPAVSSTDDDGILDLDALANEQATVGSDIEDGSLEGDDPEADAAKAKLAETPAETPEEKAKKLTGSARAKLERQRLLDDIAVRDRELETLRATRTTTTAPAAGGVTLTTGRKAHQSRSAAVILPAGRPALSLAFGHGAPILIHAVRASISAAGNFALGGIRKSSVA